MAAPVSEADIAALLAMAGQLWWHERRLLDAAEMYEVAADAIEERAATALQEFRLAGVRGAARRLRVTAWALERWPKGNIEDRHIRPVLSLPKRGESTRWVFEVVLLDPFGARQLVTIDRRGRVRLATAAEYKKARR